MTDSVATARAPAVPLVLHDPFMKVWSDDDIATGPWPKHWTGKDQPICGLARINGHR